LDAEYDDPNFMPCWPCGRRRDNDPAAAPPDQQRREDTQHVRGTVQVHLDLVMPVWVRHLQQRLERLNPGVGEDDIHTAALLLHCLGRGADLGDLALIGHVRHPPAARGRHESAGLGQVFGLGRLEIEDWAHCRRDLDPGHIGPGPRSARWLRPGRSLGQPRSLRRSGRSAAWTWTAHS
jgi:hypothetical protein